MHPPIHIEGMGVIGSVLAWTLAARNAPFTWHDAELAVCAWPACTGSVVPSGALVEQVGYRFWERWADAPPWPGNPPIIERADYWYSTKRAPAGAPAAPIDDLGSLRRYPQPSYHVHVPALVERTRAAFSAERRVSAPIGARVVVAHGYSSRLDHLVWGWSCLVELREIGLPVSTRRPCLYVQRNRFQTAYAYPCPGTSYWFAGGGHVAQRPENARLRSVASVYAAWWSLLSVCAGDLVASARQVGEIAQGWRPVGHAADAALVRVSGNRLVTRPCGASGVRWAPAVAAAVCDRLGIGETAHV